MSLRKELQQAESKGRAEAHLTDRNVRLFTLSHSPYWGVVYDGAFADERRKLRELHESLHKGERP